MFGGMVVTCTLHFCKGKASSLLEYFLLTVLFSTNQCAIKGIPPM